MIDPKKPIALLPQDREIMQITGMTEAEYREFVRQAFFYSRVRPGDPVNFSFVTFLVTLAVGLILSYIAMQMMPKVTAKKQEQYETNQIDGQNIVKANDYAPKSGFDSPQNVVDLNSVIPLVYTKRTFKNGRWYGGVRVNTNLLWSQIYTLANNQMLRALFLISEGSDCIQLDYEQFAIGNNLLRSYDLSRDDNRTSRLTVYFAPNGGRITEDDYFAGRDPVYDIGNAMNNGADDVYRVEVAEGNWEPHFCMAVKPSTQTTLGVYEMIGNRFGYKLNPDYRPVNTPQIQPGNTEIQCFPNDDHAKKRSKQRVRWWTNGRIISHQGEAAVQRGDIIEYELVPSSPVEPAEYDDNGVLEEPAEYLDVSQAIASAAKQYDESISIGDLYKIGTALAVCVERTPDDRIYVNEADFEPIVKGGGTGIKAKFEVTTGGTFIGHKDDIEDDDAYNATQTSHIFKVSIANVSIERRASVVELGIRSSTGIQFSGLTNFRDVPYGVVEGIEDEGCEGVDDCEDYELPMYGEQYLDFEACYKYEGVATNGNGCSKDMSDMVFNNRTVGTYTAKEKRYSFFRIYWRNAAADAGTEWNELGNIYGIVSETSAAIYNYIRFRFEREERWSIRMVPITGWEIRSGKYGDNDLYVMDSNIDSPLEVREDGLWIYINGYKVERTEETFRILALHPPDGIDVNNGENGYGCVFDLPTSNPDPNNFDDGEFYGDAWGRLAEDFYFNEINVSTSGPEHEIVYANVVNSNSDAPTYANLALVGMNIRSSREITRLEQFSVYVNHGLGKSLSADIDPTTCSTNLFPDVLHDLLTNERYGLGSIVSEALIDKDSFIESARWTWSNNFFFDGTISKSINVRSWAAETAAHFLLDFCVSGGRFFLKPSVTFGAPEQIAGLFTAGNIMDNTFKMNYVDQQDRQPPVITVRWREERESSVENNRGLFPVFREVTVSETGTPPSAPLEEIDISNFATSLDHAVSRAKFECRLRRLVTHSVKFTTTPTEAQIAVGTVIKLGLETVNYQQPCNGAIDGDGRVTAWPGLADGRYDVLLWDGSANAVRETELIINNQKSLDYPNAVFCLQNKYNKADGYKVTSVGFDEDGNVEVEAMYWPLDDNDYSLITKDWQTASAWQIEGSDA